MTSKILSMSAAAVFALALPASAGAQAPLGWQVRYESSPSQYYQYSRRYEDARRVARDRGYQEGLHHGEQAARRHKAFDLNREKDYRNGDEGYNRSFGSREEYREAYRGGFAEGYREAYDRYGYRVRRQTYYAPYAPPRDYGYGGVSGSVGVYGQAVSIGFQHGANDGYRRGVDDVRHHRYPDVDRQDWYRDGDRGYNRRYGSRDAYRADYRRGFDEGYRRAFGR